MFFTSPRMWLARCIYIIAYAASGKARALQQTVNDNTETDGEPKGYLDLPFVASRACSCCNLDHGRRGRVAEPKGYGVSTPKSQSQQVQRPTPVQIGRRFFAVGKIAMPPGVLPEIASVTIKGVMQR